RINAEIRREAVDDSGLLDGVTLVILAVAPAVRPLEARSFEDLLLRECAAPAMQIGRGRKKRAAAERRAGVLTRHVDHAERSRSRGITGNAAGHERLFDIAHRGVE